MLFALAFFYYSVVLLNSGLGPPSVDATRWTRIVHGSWGSWRYGTCSVTCGEGRRQRMRSCDSPAPANGGQNCVGLSVVKETCWQPECIYEEFDLSEPWSEWSQCSGRCGKGTRTRSRKCLSDGRCSDPQVEECYDDSIPPCPIDGGWSSWFQFSSCPRSADKVCQDPRRYQQVKMRFCSSPYPAYGGKACQGPEYNYTSCLTFYPQCLKAHWSPWTVGSCSVSCGRGVFEKVRTCVGADRSERKCIGPFVASQPCVKPSCPAGWSEWRETWPCKALSCDSLQGSETRILERTCHGGACPGAYRRIEDCREYYKCDTWSLSSTLTAMLSTTSPFMPTSWSDWENVGSCGVTCGEGVQQRKRICVPETENCVGPSEELVPCRMADCANQPQGSDNYLTVTLTGNGDYKIEKELEGSGTPNKFTAWSQWSTCSERCTRRRQRTCKQLPCDQSDTFQDEKCSQCSNPRASTARRPAASMSLGFSSIFALFLHGQVNFRFQNYVYF